MKKNTYVLGERIKLLRKNTHLKQSELADLLNVSCASISQYESGQRTPNDELKIKIADFFKVSIDFLIGHNLKENNMVFKALSKRQHALLEISEKLNKNDFDKVLEYTMLLATKKHNNFIQHTKKED